MIAPLSLLLIAPPIIAAFLLARAAMPRWRPAMVMLLCAMSAVPLAGAWIVAAEVGGAGPKLLSLSAILLGSIALVAGFGLVERALGGSKDDPA
ncbi:hypothetical protein [Sphingobium naphthae]|uniref:Uncharacterized protein n=1 Tax=Sphingobium naphthae TaxID=1886786 RepID=A0ABU3ZVH9_9SPHN|nr:hypothetical protein [Sphingobium naphthae]MAN11851.1 hypothetical protein [Sphingobium sp.]MEC7932306.1 hypothetical protein [Pseudomonadota bacterium]MCC4251885.1 hypothetical protein [Sphingobium naphthae]MDV5823504.1 hypothetical protein [Sphingobium naphthae]MEC8034179.1 hypothetical protein [Pseudomonadota bacterium]|tara:strand:+ start:782 stop:1063 length:282 start_codon:yes stop_codon:yes gene_type:complete